MFYFVPLIVVYFPDCLWSCVDVYAFEEVSTPSSFYRLALAENTLYQLAGRDVPGGSFGGVHREA